MEPIARNTSENPVWPLTDWSGVRRAGESVGRDAERLDDLMRKYYAPLKLHLTCTFRISEDEAQELLQDFAKDKILKEGWLLRADRDRGRFRSFLKTSLENFARSKLARKKQVPLSLEELGKEIPIEDLKADEFDINWSRIVIAEALKRMEKDCKQGRDQPRRSRIWEIFKLRVLQSALEEVPLPDYGEMVNQLGIESPERAHNMLATAKRIFERHLRQTIREYETNDAAAKAELEDLKRLLLRLSGLTK